MVECCVGVAVGVCVCARARCTAWDILPIIGTWQEEILPLGRGAICACEMVVQWVIHVAKAPAWALIQVHWRLAPGGGGDISEGFCQEPVTIVGKCGGGGEWKRSKNCLFSDDQC